MINLITELDNVYQYDQVRNLFYKNGFEVAIPVYAKKILDLLLMQKENKVMPYITLGLECNYSCEYCIQKGVKPLSGKYDASALVNKVIDYCQVTNSLDICKIYLWGGEPLYYIDKMKVYIDEFSKRLRPEQCNFAINTNGYYLKDKCISNWIKNQNNLSLELSYDGPGQHLRDKEDILDNKDIADTIRWLIANQPQRLLFCATMTKDSWSYNEYAKWVCSKLGIDNFNFLKGYNALIRTEEAFNVAIPIENLPIVGKDRYLDMVCNRMGSISNPYVNLPIHLLMNTGKEVPDNKVCRLSEVPHYIFDEAGNLVSDTNLNSHSTSHGGISNLIGNIFTNKFDYESLQNKRIQLSHDWKCRECAIWQMCWGSMICYSVDTYDTYNCTSCYYETLPALAMALEYLTSERVRSVSPAGPPSNKIDRYDFY